MEYVSVFLLFIVSIFMACVFILIPLFLAPTKKYREKLLPYECGFDTYSSPLVGNFNVNFYIVSVLFVIFDIEMGFLIPWSLILDTMDGLTFFSMVIFFVLVTLGFIYEFVRKALDW